MKEHTEFIWNDFHVAFNWVCNANIDWFYHPLRNEYLSSLYAIYVKCCPVNERLYFA